MNASTYLHVLGTMISCNVWRQGLVCQLLCLWDLQKLCNRCSSAKAKALDNSDVSIGAGLNMKQLLETSPADIKLKKRDSSTMSPIRRFQLIKFIVRSMKFMFGDHFAEGIKGLLFWLLRGFATEKEHKSGPKPWETPERNFPQL